MEKKLFKNIGDAEKAYERLESKYIKKCKSLSYWINKFESLLNELGGNYGRENGSMERT